MEAKPSGGADAPNVAGSPQKRAEARLGAVIGGRMTLESVLGTGGTATVYAARHRNGRALAVKILHPELAHHTAMRQRFLAEGYAANKVDHPDAVAVLDEGEDSDGTVFLVMERLYGRTLLERLSEEGPLPAAAVVAMAQRVLAVLAQAHDRGVVHRDVKPSNIFETNEGRILLLDFGSARMQEGRTAFLTRPGSTLGTPAFMAPELAAGRLEELDALTDVWALGATMFQLLTAEVVHPSDNDNELLVLAATRPARSLGSVRPDLEPELVRVIDRALAFERTQRWPNARAMSRALAADARVPTRAREASGTAPEMELPALRADKPARAGLRWVLVWGTLLLLAVAFLAKRYAARMGERARYDAPLVLPVSAAIPAVHADAPQPTRTPTPTAAPEPRADSPARVAPALNTAHLLPTRNATQPAAKAKPGEPNQNPLFFPTQLSP